MEATQWRAQTSTPHVRDFDSPSSSPSSTRDRRSPVLQRPKLRSIATEASVEEATRAYEIAMLRYREGVSIQLELSDARLGSSKRAPTRRVPRAMSRSSVSAQHSSPISRSAPTAQLSRSGVPQVVRFPRRQCTNSSHLTSDTMIRTYKTSDGGTPPTGAIGPRFRWAATAALIVATPLAIQGCGKSAAAETPRIPVVVDARH